ncbi:sigma factor-like helix-turn-helix DNA-binding protein [Bacillus smithii]|uniref:sigma factor-like helix-turn-helix DNA-binding protein n=1 Tax=Bacillus smithii TaxID=1479 RepID=UPI003D22CBDE
MGSVKFDLTKNEIKLKDLGLNSVEDIYDLLFRLDIIQAEKEQGNNEAFFLFNDLINSLQYINENKYIKSYIDIQLGITPMGVDDFDKEVEEVCSERMGISIDEFKNGLHKNIEDIYKYLKNKRSKWIDSYYKNKVIDTNLKVNKEYELLSDVTKLYQIDFNKKYMDHKIIYRNIEKPKSLEELESYQKELELKIKDTKRKLNKYRKKDNKKFFKYKNELSKLQSLNIQVRKDINIIRECYGETLGHQNKKGKKDTVSYDSNMSEIVNAHEEQLAKERYESYSAIDANIEVGKLQKIAEKKLTNRQYIIFELYYLNGMTQQEIAEIMGSFQPNVKRDINKINKILNENI